MARFLIEYYSNALRRTTSFYAVIPNDPRREIPWEKNQFSDQSLKALFLLHGYTGRSECWIPQEMLEKYHLAVFSPTAENSFYTDGEAVGRQYETMVALELVDYVRATFHLALKPEETFIAGMSMGGYGSLHLALAHPDRFSKAGCMSSALIVPRVSQMKPGENDGLANYAYYRDCFGDPLSEAINREVNPEVQVKKLKDAGVKLPDLYLCCGTEDFLIEPNRDFHRFLEDEGVSHVYVEEPGQHDMVFWLGSIERILAWMTRA